MPKSVLVQILQKAGLMGASHSIWSRFCRRGCGIWGICHSSGDGGRVLALGALLLCSLSIRLGKGISDSGRHGWMGTAVSCDREGKLKKFSRRRKMEITESRYNS